MSLTSVRCPACGHILVSVELRQELAAAAPSSRLPDAPILLRMTEAAKLLSISRSTMYQLVAQGALPVVRIGRSVRVSRAVLDRMAS